ncbi:MAG: PEP-CTERM sorting domain-containing protein [Verrucomicrobia bacterium]|nr:PEP-CTERM sorting domain-containing protein [Verrucomicrobiota bacterium]
MKKRSFWLSLATVFVLSVESPAVPIVDFSDLDFEFGSGAYMAAFVVDWNDGTSADSFTWSLNWDSAPSSVADAMLALDSADPSLHLLFTDFGPGLGLFLDGAGFDAEASGIPDYGGPNDHFKDRAGGWADTFSFWLGAASDESWTSSGSGISATPVQDGYAYGFAWNDTGGYPGPQPNAVPEPGTPVLLVIGAGIVGVVRASKWFRQ